MRPVRLSEAAVDDITTQVPGDRLEGFRVHDLAPALHFMSTTSALGDYLADAGPAWRYTVQGSTVAGFHMFVADDDVDPREGALVVVQIDVWLDDFPE